MNQRLNRNDPHDASDFAGLFVRPRQASGGVNPWRTGPRLFGERTDPAVAPAAGHVRRDDRNNGCCTPDDEHARMSS